MKIYLRIVAAFYLLGAIAHLLDLLDLRLVSSSMTRLNRLWTVSLLIIDSVLCLGLWKGRSWAVALLIVVAISQIVAYTSFRAWFGTSTVLVAFHVLTLFGLVLLWVDQQKRG